MTHKPIFSPVDPITKLFTGPGVMAALAFELAGNGVDGVDGADAVIPERLSEIGLNATIAELAAPARADGSIRADAPLMIVAPVTITTGIVQALVGYNTATGTYYGNSASNGHYVTSTDGVTWTDRTYSPSVYTPTVNGYEFDATNMYAYNTAGKIWRAPLDVFNGWVEISVPTRGPLTTGRPGSLLALGAGVLLYGNYTSGVDDGSHVWRSTDAGATWALVIDNPAGKHIHAIRKSPNTGAIWVSVGDAGHEGTGLWKSTDNGATFTHMSTNEYGIDMVFIPAYGSRPPLVVLEGDGLNRPHLVAFPENGEAGDKTFPLTWFTGAPADALSTRGTTRGLGVTANGDMVYFITTEAGAVGTKAGLYVSPSPDYSRAVLLKDTTGAEPVAYGRSFVVGATVRNLQLSFPLPTFATY